MQVCISTCLCLHLAFKARERHDYCRLVASRSRVTAVRWREARQRDQKLSELHYHFKDTWGRSLGCSTWALEEMLRSCYKKMLGSGSEGARCMGLVWEDAAFAAAVLPEAARHTFGDLEKRLNPTPEPQERPKSSYPCRFYECL